MTGENRVHNTPRVETIFSHDLENTRRLRLVRGILALPLVIVVVRYALLAPEPWHGTANQALLARVRDGAGAADFGQLLTTFSPPLGLDTFSSRMMPVRSRILLRITLKA